MTLSFRQLWLWAFFALAMLGCQRKETLPTPKDKVPTATIDKIKAWYEPKIARLRGAKTTGVDIYLPQWGDGKLYTLPTGERIALFPAHREKRVQYFDIGFVRRFGVKLDAQDNVKSVKLLEVVGKKEYLRDHKDEVFEKHIFQRAEGLPVIVMERDVDFTVEKGQICPLHIIGMLGNVLAVGDGCGNTWTYVFNDGGGDGTSSFWANPNPVSSGGSALYYDYTYINYYGGTGGGSTGATSNIQIGGGSIYNADPSFPIALGDPDPVPPTDEGDNTDPSTEPFRKITLDSAFQNHPRVMCVYNRIKEMVEGTSTSPDNNLFWRLSLPFSGLNDLRLNIALVDSTQMTRSTWDGEVIPDDIPNGFITLKINRQLFEATSDINGANTILHELMHAYYYALIEKMGGESALLAYTGTQEPYKSLKYFYQTYADKEAQHNAMASNTYRGFMIKAMKAFMGANQLADELYEGISWAGLGRTEAWDKLEESKQNNIDAALKLVIKKGADNKDQCE